MIAIAKSPMPRPWRACATAFLALVAVAVPAFAASDSACPEPWVELPTHRMIPCSMAPARFSASFVEDQPGGTEIRRSTFVATDPRISGTWTQGTESHGKVLAYVKEGSDEPLFILSSVPVRIENPDGAWSGRSDELRLTDTGADDEFLDSQTVLAGEGAYEGLTAVLYSPQDDWNYVGAIFPAPMPEPEPPGAQP